ncbi:PREDICTED: F-box protein SKIP31-like [Camelina sativa]|uniref:F-box protein SKIP31-like n=1 Tax=Camelina sativa TaxID=90675 RepID=A0ABM0Y2X5_CAMSA|nr:PREDICTED: F-box protein SKIP31-like [Camelina sativa]
MSGSDEEDECFARFLESEVSSVEETKNPEEPEAKRQRIEKHEETTSAVEKKKDEDHQMEDGNKDRTGSKRIESGVLSSVPTELFRHILKFLSSEDLVSCSLVCRFLNFAASDESLWRRLYCIRWGLTPPTRKLRECAWKKLYIDRDEQDMIELVRTCPSDFKEYYIQMQAAKRSQAPLPSEMVDDRIILDKTVLEQVSLWKKSKGLADKVVTGHICLGTKCSYHQIEDVFICKETGHVHVCDDNCKEVILSPEGDLMVCTISGLCSDTLLVQTDPDPDGCDEEEAELELEVFTDKSRLARAFELGYNCEDEQELERTLRFC